MCVYIYIYICYVCAGVHPQPAQTAPLFWLREVEWSDSPQAKIPSRSTHNPSKPDVHPNLQDLAFGVLGFSVQALGFRVSGNRKPKAQTICAPNPEPPHILKAGRFTRRRPRGLALVSLTSTHYYSSYTVILIVAIMRTTTTRRIPIFTMSPLLCDDHLSNIICKWDSCDWSAWQLPAGS